MACVAILGAGPAGLIAAEFLAGAGHVVTVYDQMASAGRKFLLAGRGGLNLTNGETADPFVARYGGAARWMVEALIPYPPDALVAWCEGLGQPTMVGSSGRVFPRAFKAAPLLRAWLRRLDGLGVRFAPRHRWLGWTADGGLHFTTNTGGLTDAGEAIAHADATLLALGGASWPRMGSDGGWVPVLRGRGVHVAPLRASNCGVDIAWSKPFLARHEGQPLKRVAMSCGVVQSRGDAVVTRAGLEGGPVYALSAPIRHALDAGGPAVLTVDLRPDVTADALASRVDGDRRGRSLANHLRQQAGLSPEAVGVLQEAIHTCGPPERLSALIKAVPLTVIGLQPVARAISSAGGIALHELDRRLMLRRLPGVFAAGEMLDWEAPTGGYLLQGCFSTGVRAARGIDAWLGDQAVGEGGAGLAASSA